MGRNSKTMLMFIAGGWLIYCISWLMPKSGNLWVYGAWFGDRYSDNSRHFFEYMNRQHPEIRSIWFSKNADTRELVRSKGYEACHPYSLKGTWCAMRARVGILSTGIQDINEYASARTLKIQLWHGTPLKKILYDDLVSTQQGRFWHLLKRALPLFRENMIAAASDTVAGTLRSAFRAKDGKVRVTGYPRTDIFFDQGRAVLPITKVINLKRKNSDTLVGIYMPTHRQAGQADIVGSFLRNIENIDLALGEANVILLVKLHFYHMKEVESLAVDMSNLVFLTEKDIDQDIYSLLPDTDFIITDYSSIYFEYLLLDKPVLFAAFDRDEYLRTEREMYFDYDEVVTGPIFDDWPELIVYCRDELRGDHAYLEVAGDIKQRFNEFQSGGSSQRVFRAVSELHMN